MFPQFKKIKNESGVVLFIVLMTAIIIMIFSLGILTQSMNEMNYAQQQIDQITSDQLAKGLWWQAYASGMSIPQGTVSAGGARNYQLTLTQNNPQAGSASNSFSVVANYDTFQ